MYSWKYHWLRIDGVYFEDTKEMVANTTGFAMESKTWKRHPKGMDEMSLRIFFFPNEGIIHLHVEFSRKKTLKT